MESFPVDILVREALGELQSWFSVRTNEFGWNEEKTVSYGLQVEALPSSRETRSFEPVEKIVGKEDQVEIRLIGSPIS